MSAKTGDGLAALRDAWLARTTITQEELEADYVFVRLGDVISLAFCTGNAALPVPGGWRVESDGDRVVVSPDGFDGPVPLAVEAKTPADVLKLLGWSEADARTPGAYPLRN